MLENIEKENDVIKKSLQIIEEEIMIFFNVFMFITYLIIYDLKRLIPTLYFILFVIDKRNFI